MATALKTAVDTAVDTIEEAGEDIGERLAEQISVLGKEIAAIAESVAEYSEHAFSDARHGTAVAARRVGHQAAVAGNAMRENPVPVVVTLATIALVAALIFKRD